MKNFLKLFGTQSRWLCAITLAAVIGFSFAACGDEEDNTGGSSGSDYYGYGGGYTSGGTWPPANILSKYGLSGLSSPPGATNIYWADYKNYQYETSYAQALYISFEGTTATSNSIKNYFNINNSWENYMEQASSGGSQYVYRSSPDKAVIYQEYGSNSVLIAYLGLDLFYDDDDDW